MGYWKQLASGKGGTYVFSWNDREGSLDFERHFWFFVMPAVIALETAAQGGEWKVPDRALRKQRWRNLVRSYVALGAISAKACRWAYPAWLVTMGPVSSKSAPSAPPQHRKAAKGVEGSSKSFGGVDVDAP